MEAQYTETLQEYLDNNGGDFPTTVKNLLMQIPNFTFKDVDLDIDIDFSFLTLFKDKYDIREIGAETEQLFEHYLIETAQHCIIEYVPKIYMWVKNFKELFKFTVKLEYSNDDTNVNTYYLNPINTSTENLKVQDVDKSEVNSSGSRDVLQSVWGKTRANLMEQIFNLKDIYNDCLEYFQKCFMGVY